MNGSMDSKPFKGSIRDWKIVKNAYGEYIVGLFDSHPEFAGRYGHTSQIVSKKDCGAHWEIETLNSQYWLYFSDEEPDREFWGMS